jgi:hypothetical protein
MYSPVVFTRFISISITPINNRNRVCITRAKALGGATGAIIGTAAGPRGPSRW